MSLVDDRWPEYDDEDEVDEHGVHPRSEYARQLRRYRSSGFDPQWAPDWSPGQDE
jgi:hypothetical protein